jgi:hypothetical protein
MGYIEPAPLLDKENPFEAMMSRFREASQILGLEEDVYNVLKSPAKAGNCIAACNHGRQQH